MWHKLTRMARYANNGAGLNMDVFLWKKVSASRAGSIQEGSAGDSTSLYAHRADSANENDALRHRPVTELGPLPGEPDEEVAQRGRVQDIPARCGTVFKTVLPWIK